MLNLSAQPPLPTFKNFKPTARVCMALRGNCTWMTEYDAYKDDLVTFAGTHLAEMVDAAWVVWKMEMSFDVVLATLDRIEASDSGASWKAGVLELVIFVYTRDFHEDGPEDAFKPENALRPELR